MIIWLVIPSLADTPLALAVLQGVCAASIGYGMRGPVWWIPIHCGFLPAAALASRLAIGPGWYLTGFLLLLLVYWRTDKSRVPLYLSNATTADAVLQLLPADSCRVVDLGCGDAGLIRRLARSRPDCSFVGIEHAPLPWLWGRLASLTLPNLQIRYGDFWQLDLEPFEFAYAFLSPVPMPRLMDKVRNEMRSGTRLVSNSFAVPSVPPETVVQVADRRATQLFCYRL